MPFYILVSVDEVQLLTLLFNFILDFTNTHNPLRFEKIQFASVYCFFMGNILFTFIKLYL